VRRPTPGTFITGDRISEGIPGERGLFEGKVKADVLKEVVDVVSTLVDEAKFNVGKDSITVKAVDPAHVAMVDLTLDRGSFEAYKADEGAAPGDPGVGEHQRPHCTEGLARRLRDRVGGGHRQRHAHGPEGPPRRAAGEGGGAIALPARLLLEHGEGDQLRADGDPVPG